MASNVPRDELVDAYLEYGRGHDEHGKTSDDLFWAYNAVTKVIEGPSADDALALTVALVHAAPPALLHWVAAGPVEDLLVHHGPAIVNQILEIAVRDARMQSALEGVWGRERMQPDVWRRVQQALAGWK